MNIVFKKDGIKYKYSELSKKESGNIIQVDLELLRDIVNKKKNSISRFFENDEDSLTFSIPDDVIDYLANKYKTKYPDKSDEDLKNIVINEVNRAFKNIDYLSVVLSGDISDIKIRYRSLQKQVNEDEKYTPVNYSDVITEIDISKIDPNQVAQKIKEKVIAQDQTVDTILYNIYNNQYLIENGSDELAENKVNIILDGPTGTGKTFILKEVAKNLSIPITISPADMYAVPGYKGAQLEEMLVGLLDQTGGNVELAERGIVVLDEFDKLCAKGNKSLEMHKAIQHNLLTYIGGTKINLEYNGKKIEFDTSKITFICLGAFTDLRERKIREELDENNQYLIEPSDYIDAGLERELVGRFSLVAATQALSKENLVRILKESKVSPLKNLIEIGKLYGKDIKYDEVLVEKIAQEAYDTGTGARALQTVVNGIENTILKDIINPKANSEIYLDSNSVDKYKQVYIRRAA